ncbi:exodeoxyribonuclease VII large subunit [Clostridium rectalis]|uniref:exodeoxyribonuclease VII large subunit n=1 Tax=Clostridium rectalis TaxID=2040295 RepID=UPI000F62F170|nr:exodeoxyribonuclease VII large subunit [Clostridium rectalis]
MHIKTLSVSDVNNYIKKIIDNDFILNNTLVSGEISNFKLHSSGHMYFSLKDEFSKINCVMFRSNTRNLRIIPENGMKVRIRGRISVYTKDGSYQLYCDEIQMQGLGELYIAFEKLKDKLQKEGLFDENHKKPIPYYAENIGVITSSTGAAIRDIINVSKRRNANCNIYIFPALVQGIEASQTIINGINFFNFRKNVDLIIIARGGGSIEELWTFNNEELARQIYSSKIPIITGVGHETDYTIVDFVSDRRASTPSAAAEIAVLNLQEANNKLKQYKKNLNSYMINMLNEKYNKVDILNRRLNFNNPLNNIVKEYEKIDRIKKLLTHKINSYLNMNKEKLSKLNALLIARNPLSILDKGYSVIQDEDNKIVNEIEILNALSIVKITLKDGYGYFNIDKRNK